MQRSVAMAWRGNRPALAGDVQLGVFGGLSGRTGEDRWLSAGAVAGR